MKTSITVPAIFGVVLMALIALYMVPTSSHAQATTSTSEVTGTLTAGGSGGSVTGTVGTSSGSSLTGTVVSDPGSNSSSGSGGGGGSSSGGGSSGGGGGVTDRCPNIPDVQSIVPGGFTLVAGNCVQTLVGGETGTNLPGVPNTGSGGDWSLIVLALGTSLFAAVGGAVYLLTRPQS